MLKRKEAASKVEKINSLKVKPWSGCLARASKGWKKFFKNLSIFKKKIRRDAHFRMRERTC